MSGIDWVELDQMIFRRIVMWKNASTDDAEFIQRLEELLWMKHEVRKLAKNPEDAE